VLSAALLCGAALAADAPVSLAGDWVFNAEASDVTDEQVERAIKRGGGRISRSFGKAETSPEGIPIKYKGGPEDQALYDHLAYDPGFSIEQDGAEFRLSYPEGFERRFSTDRRSRTITASGSARSDFSFAYWEGATLVVESRPLDGGRLSERYSLIPETGQLRVEMSMEPLKFRAPIDLVRVFDRAGTAAPASP
jgi:hypothetical protein